MVKEVSKKERGSTSTFISWLVKKCVALLQTMLSNELVMIHFVVSSWINLKQNRSKGTSNWFILDLILLDLKWKGFKSIFCEVIVWKGFSGLFFKWQETDISCNSGCRWNVRTVFNSSRLRIMVYFVNPKTCVIYFSISFFFYFF